MAMTHVLPPVAARPEGRARRVLARVAFVGFGGDLGGAAGAGLYRPTALYVDPHNHIYVAEGGMGTDESKTGTSRIRTITGPL